MNAMIIGNFYHLSCLSDKKIKKNNNDIPKNQSSFKTRFIC